MPDNNPTPQAQCNKLINTGGVCRCVEPTPQETMEKVKAKTSTVVLVICLMLICLAVGNTLGAGLAIYKETLWLQFLVTMSHISIIVMCIHSIKSSNRKSND